MNKSTPNSANFKDLTKITTYQAGVMQTTVNRQLQHYCDEVLKPYGITKAQWFIIGMVWDGGAEGVRITDLATKLDTGLPYLTNAINLLQSKGILRRVEHGTDSRSKMVTVHSEFAPNVGEIEETLRVALRRTIYGQIPPEDFLTYMRVMYQLANVGKTEQ